MFIIHSQTLAKQQVQGLETRLHNAQQKLIALTLQKGRGKRQITSEQVLLQNATEIRRQHRVEGLLSFDYECQETFVETYIGRGRASERPKQIIQKIRYQIQTVIRNESAIAQAQKTFGWRAFVSNAPSSTLSIEQAVLTYRDEWIAERGFHFFTLHQKITCQKCLKHLLGKDYEKCDRRTCSKCGLEYLENQSN